MSTPLSPPSPQTRRPPQSLPLSPESLMVCTRTTPVYDPFGQGRPGHLDEPRAVLVQEHEWRVRDGLG
jgi:hypothetical protein